MSEDRIRSLAKKVTSLSLPLLMIIPERLPSSVLAGQSPYSYVYGRNPTLSYLKVYGCLCYATTLNNHDKFNSSQLYKEQLNPKRPNDKGRVLSNNDGIKSNPVDKGDDDFATTFIEENEHPEGNTDSIN
ncbi:hypothetical protein Tco_1274343 [Tanacetum coccineum]